MYAFRLYECGCLCAKNQLLRACGVVSGFEETLDIPHARRFEGCREIFARGDSAATSEPFGKRITWCQVFLFHPCGASSVVRGCGQCVIQWWHHCRRLVARR